MVYNFEKKGTVLTDREDQFGVVSGGEDGCIKYGKYWIPTVSYVIMAGHNYVMAQTTADGIYDSQDGNIRMARFKSDKFQADVLTLNAVEEEKLVTLDLGTDRVTCYDYKGNTTELVGKDGVFTIAALERPVYLVGDIRTVELLQTGPIETEEPVEILEASNEDVRIKGALYGEEPYRISAELCFSGIPAGQSWQLYAAVYRKDTLTMMQIVSGVISEEKRVQIQDLGLRLSPGTYDSVKLILLESDESMRPLCTAARSKE